MAVNRESWCEFEKVTLKVVSRAGPLIREALLVDTLQVVERKHPHPGGVRGGTHLQSQHQEAEAG